MRRTDERNRPHQPRRSTEPVFTEPQRLHKVLAQCGYGSLRGLEELIIAGRITVNRQPAEVGQKVGPNDQIRINGELVRLRFAAPRVRVLLYHKPAGEIVSRSDPEGRPTVFDKLPRIGGAKWVAVGRLDFNSEGLLIFTTSGELANRMMHPRYQVERVYSVRVMGTLTPEQEKKLLEGVELDDGVAKVLSLADGGGEGANHWYTLTLPEGRNKEVRRLFEVVGLMVSRLIRTRYGVVSMPPQLKRGQTLELEREDLERVLVAAGLATAESRSEGANTQPGNSSDDQPEGGEEDVDGNRAAPVVPEDHEARDVDGNRGARGSAPAPAPASRAPRHGAHNRNFSPASAPAQPRGRRGGRGGHGGHGSPGSGRR